ncbi:hypothetical protein LCGC14_0302430 [marine sediment metagenome]|uniref:Glycosyltransferase RgtA/B/C/D-like domain-containing protein n=1 Tax=marine sediment metagenome TaxID=412755 RepID=A0A0F9TUV5_9ZZZZ
MAADLLLVAVLLSAVVAVRATGPSNTHKYAQRFQVGVAVAMIDSGEWLLPRDQKGEYPRKPPLWAWLCAGGLMATGVYDDFVFRLPSMAAAWATVSLVYLLGVRWWGRRAGLLAAVFWTTAMTTSKLAYVANTDMLLTLWMTVSLFALDRLLFHPRRRRWPWAVALWLSMILAAFTKGLGIVNLPIVGLFVALATATRPGFRVLRIRGPMKLPLAVRLIGRRWWAAVRRSWLLVGLPVFVLAVGSLVWVIWLRAGEEFERTIGFEIVQRITGGGESPPRPTSVPAALQLLYYALPMSIFAVAALVLTPLKRWFTRRGAISIPLCWVIATVLPFSLAYGFRADYLMPCFSGVALMAAWAVSRVADRGRSGGALRHVLAGVPVVVGAGMIVFAVLYFAGGARVGFFEAYRPAQFSVTDRLAWAGVIVLGVVVAAGGVIASLRWRIRTVAVLGCVGMLGVGFIYVHVASRPARTRTGEHMRSFAMAARGILGDDDYAAFAAENLVVGPYLGRLGELIMYNDPLRQINASEAPWLLTCDRGLVELGASSEVAAGEYKIRIEGVKRWFQTHPKQLGEVALVGERIYAEAWGHIYLIRLARPVRVDGIPTSTVYVSDDGED